MMAKEEPPICGTLLTTKHSLISISECFIVSKLANFGNMKHKEKTMYLINYTKFPSRKWKKQIKSYKF